VAKKQTKQKAETKNKPKQDSVLEDCLKDFENSWKYCAGTWHDRWSNNYSLYHGNRVKRGYEGITDTFVPMTFSTVETMTSALFGSKPKFAFMAPREKPDQKTDILNALLDYYWDKDQWSIKVINTGRSMLMLGTGVDYFCWENDHPVMINVPLRDFIFDPTATSFENARFLGRRYLTTLKELESFEIVDLDGKPDEEGSYPMKAKYTNLDQLKTDNGSNTSTKGKGVATEKTDKQEKDHLFGSTLSGDGLDDQIEVIELWYEDRTVSIANRKVVIEDTENYYKAKARANGVKYPKGILPFTGARDYVDESLLLAKGEVDFIADPQELLNDITNQNIDSITFTLNQMYTLDPKYKDMLSEIENLPGAVYPVEAGALMPIQQRPIPPDAFNERMNIKNEIRETTASNEVVKGVGEAAGASATATEINAQIAGAGQRINLKITQVENEYFHRLARIVFEMVKLYVTEPTMVRIVGKDGARWEEFDPSQYSDGEYEPRAQLDIRMENKKAEDAAKAKEMLAAFLNDPDINQQELKKMVLAKSFDLDPDEVEILVNPMQPPVAPGTDPMAALLGGATPPAGAPTDMPEEDKALMQQQAQPESAPAADPFDETVANPDDVIVDPETGLKIPVAALEHA
jgi:hypothetical protein